MPKVRCSECQAIWEQPRGVLIASRYERHHPGCTSAPPLSDEDNTPTGIFKEPPDPYTSLGGTP